MKYSKLLLIFVLFIPVTSSMFSQSKLINRNKYIIHINGITDKIDLDGLLDEDTWRTAEKSGKFNQVDNLNTNIRFQWRFAPVSDLYIVYSENSYTGDFTAKNRGLVVKVSYWFN